MSSNNTYYTLDRQLLSIHSEDRDYSKWPNANTFEIILPEAYMNIQSLRLLQISLPSNYYTFSNYYQNTKLSFKIKPKITTETMFHYLLSNTHNDYTITIQEGYYTEDELAYELQNKMNDAVTDYLISVGMSSTTVYDRIQIYYDSVSQKIWFGNTADQFILNFSSELSYDLSACDQTNIWDQYTKWGLPSYIGFNKETYTASTSSTDITFDYLGEDTDTTWLDASSNDVWYIEAPLTMNIRGEKNIYMEIEKYNSYDELYPYSELTSNTYNNDYGGKNKSAFAKIPVTLTPNNTIFNSNDLIGLSVFMPPLERLQKLKFKFRYHDGRLVDFKETPLDFTIEILYFKNAIQTKYNNPNVPSFYP
tara:strand:- start:358 stop:1449 length:1092 start_codon:yes stop_codon:yes gene_type:complete